MFLFSVWRFGMLWVSHVDTEMVKNRMINWPHVLLFYAASAQPANADARGVSTRVFKNGECYLFVLKCLLYVSKPCDNECASQRMNIFQKQERNKHKQLLTNIKQKIRLTCDFLYSRQESLRISRNLLTVYTVDSLDDDDTVCCMLSYTCLNYGA